MRFDYRVYLDCVYYRTDRLDGLPGSIKKKEALRLAMDQVKELNKTIAGMKMVVDFHLRYNEGRTWL